MSVKRELDFDKRCIIWTVYDEQANEIMKIIMKDGELYFYKKIED